MLSINVDEKLITMRMCLMGLLSSGEHNKCSQTELVKWAGCLAEGLLQEHRKTSNAVELASTDSQQYKGKIIAFDSIERTVTVELYDSCDGLVMGMSAAITSPVA